MPRIRVEVVCVGTELLTGRINTHASFLGVKLAEIGLSIDREHTVPDDEAVMRETFREALRRADVVLCCGGLGPTFDDVTRDVWSRVTGRALIPNAALERDIRRKFASRGLAMPPANLRQALVLRGATPIRNPHGTAPGQFLQQGRKILALLPGPARELMPMFDGFLRPRLARLSGLHYFPKTFLIAGVPESRVDERIRPLVDRSARVGGCDVVHGILASHSVITVKFRVAGRTRRAVTAAGEKLAREFRAILGGMVVAEDVDALETAVGDLLTRRKKTVALAESCTGGLIARMLTDRPGSSAYFDSGVVTYSNRSKSRLLGVPARLLGARGPGAVSEAVAREMAIGARRQARTDFGLSVTGIAGPGAEGRKPVGLVFIACASSGGVAVKQFNFSGDRAWIRQRSAVMALDLLRQSLVGG